MRMTSAAAAIAATSIITIALMIQAGAALVS